VANAIKCGKLFDAEILEIAKSYIKPNSTILDIGANYGQMAIELSKISTGTSIFAFESQKMVYESLEKNIMANHSANVMSFYNTVYDTNNVELINPESDLEKFSSNGSYGLDVEVAEEKLAKSITIDRLRFYSRVSFMKINSQGMDLAAMKGAVNTISKYQMPIIFKYEKQLQADFNTSFQYYIDFVDSINYKFLKTIDDINYLIVPN
jgi:FkbM family methyltransferase